ncbi:hypothetical protein OJF2_45030 [Aquisphaera giovannonii]|uniref:MucB/RseB N-terminal domain-containing protein n=1 Tax=Aquisphaera giovannonii TaxID=406548 RepID=A0A5B9W5J9_9BACT|nr:hypothetical protein [Aquisphaera giovannonii]QEH35946.1 hypothetical protein OJF2_45030 [Aquisphaera giovannonii]
MGRMGDVLEVLFGPDDRIRTVRATIRQWEDRGLARRLSGRAWPRVGRMKEGAEAGQDRPRAWAATLEIWLSRPGCVRIERRVEAEDGTEVSLVVTDGDRRWDRDAEGHVTTRDGEAGRREATGDISVDIDVDRHFNPAQIREFLTELAVEARGPARVAGRDCERLRATRRPGRRLWPHWLGNESEEFEFHADLERGALLTIIGRHGGVEVVRYEALAVSFDDPIDPALFTYEADPGDQVEPRPAAVEQLSIAGEVERMPFVVLVPTRVPDAAHALCEFHYFPPSRRQRWPHLSLMYRGSEAVRGLSISESDRPKPDLDRYEWDQVEAGPDAPQSIRISDSGEPGSQRLVAFEQEGTHVTIRSDLDREALIDLARSFVRAGTSPT